MHYRFGEDGWVYINGVRTRKFLSPAGPYKRIWAPDLDKPARILALWRRLDARLQVTWQRFFDMAFELLPEGENHTAVMIHRPRRELGPMRVDIERLADDPTKCTYFTGYETKGDEPTAPNSFAMAYWYNLNAAYRANGMRALLEHALHRMVWNAKPDVGVPVRIRLEGLDFWFVMARRRDDSVYIHTLAWWDSPTVVIDLDAETAK